jgi:folate-dependent tRNA-U54 methylase TrmFO/GidA
VKTLCVDAIVITLIKSLEENAELREAAQTTGIVGVVVTAAARGLIAPVLVAALALTAPFAWIGAIAGIGAAVALPFFRKLNKRREDRS